MKQYDGKRELKWRISGCCLLIVSGIFFLATPLRAQETDTTEPQTDLADTGQEQNFQETDGSFEPQINNDEVAPISQEKDEAERRLEQILEDLSEEPALETLLQAALKLADADVAGAGTWQRRVRKSPLLPSVKVSVGYDLEHDESLDKTQTDPDQWGADTDRDLGFQATLQWDFSRVIYHPEELKIYSALAKRADRREAVSTMLIGYWFERRQRQIMLAVKPPSQLEERIRQTLRIKELTACIDALTGGRLTRT